jgi:hypothetical protein
MTDADEHNDTDTTDERTGDEIAATLAYDTGDLIDDDRDTHGDAVVNQQHIAQGWSWYLAQKDDPSDIGGEDVAAMMSILKMSRSVVGEKVLDHYRDMVGYGAIGGACLYERGEADEEIERGSYEDAHVDGDDGT